MHVCIKDICLDRHNHSATHISELSSGFMPTAEATWRESLVNALNSWKLQLWIKRTRVTPCPHPAISPMLCYSFIDLKLLSNYIHEYRCAWSSLNGPHTGSNSNNPQGKKIPSPGISKSWEVADHNFNLSIPPLP